MFYPKSFTRPLLLYLEWGLLIVILFGEFLPIGSYFLPKNIFINILFLSTFVITGLIPKLTKNSKILCFLTEVFLIIILSTIGGLRFSALLFIILVIRDSYRFRGNYGWLALFLSFTIFIFTLVYRLEHLITSRPLDLERDSIHTIIILLIIFMAIILVFTRLIVNMLIKEKQDREKLEKAHERLRVYANRVQELATAEERNRIAREIHDSLGHSLVAFNLHLEAAIRLIEADPDESKALLQEARELAAVALKEVRLSVFTLRSDPLQGQSLHAALGDLLKEFSRSTGIVPICNFQLIAPLSREHNTAIYRIVQEALTNIGKYARATEVRIDINNKQGVGLIITDNGVGFNVRENTAGYGLRGMGERVELLRGTIDISSEPGTGCTIRVSLPIDTDDPSPSSR